MKYRKPFVLSTALLCALLLMGATYQQFRKGIAIFNCADLTVAETTTMTGAVTMASTLAVTGAQTNSAVLTRAGLIQTATAASLTSPGVTFAVTSATDLISLTSDANQTAIVLTGGSLNQIVMIVSGAGSNTMQFDDNATSMVIGGNITLTEGQNDVLTLRCLDTEGVSWARVSNGDN